MQIKKTSSQAFFILSVLIFGFFLGGFLGGKVFGSGMGFDRLADALGGMMLGVIGALILGIFGVQKLTIQGCVRWAIAALVGALIVFGLLRLYPKETPTQGALQENTPSQVTERPLTTQAGF